MKLEARNIDFTYEYSQRQILSGIDLHIESGEKVALLGANGCGKTTLLKILCGLVAPTRGVIMIDGNKVKTSPGFKFSVGFVPENPEEMFFESTIEREIAFILKRKKENNIDDKVNDVMRRFDLEKLKGKSPFEISSGEKRKLSIAAVVVGEQPIVLLDEPISGLDWSGIISVETWIKNSRASIVATAHRTDFARNFDRVVLMNSGTIISDDLDIDNSRSLLEKAEVMLLWR